MSLETGKSYARALVRDIEENPELGRMFNLPPAQAGLIVARLQKDLEREAAGDFSKVLFPRVRALYRKELREKQAGMGQWAELGSALVTGITQVYTTRLENKARLDIAKLQTREQAAAAQRQAEADKATAAASIQQAAAQSPEVTAVQTAGMFAGLPGWALPVALGGVALLAGASAIFGGKKSVRKRSRTRRRA